VLSLGLRRGSNKHPLHRSSQGGRRDVYVPKRGAQVPVAEGVGNEGEIPRGFVEASGEARPERVQGQRRPQARNGLPVFTANLDLPGAEGFTASAAREQRCRASRGGAHLIAVLAQGLGKALGHGNEAGPLTLSRENKEGVSLRVVIAYLESEYLGPTQTREGIGREEGLIAQAKPVTRIADCGQQPFDLTRLDGECGRRVGSGSPQVPCRTAGKVPGLFCPTEKRAHGATHPVQSHRRRARPPGRTQAGQLEEGEVDLPWGNGGESGVPKQINHAEEGMLVA